MPTRNIFGKAQLFPDIIPPRLSMDIQCLGTGKVSRAILDALFQIIRVGIDWRAGILTTKGTRCRIRRVKAFVIFCG